MEIGRKKIVIVSIILILVFCSLASGCSLGKTVIEGFKWKTINVEKFGEDKLFTILEAMRTKDKEMLKSVFSIYTLERIDKDYFENGINYLFDSTDNFSVADIYIAKEEGSVYFNGKKGVEAGAGASCVIKANQTIYILNASYYTFFEANHKKDGVTSILFVEKSQYDNMSGSGGDKYEPFFRQATPGIYYPDWDIKGSSQ